MKRPTWFTKKQADLLFLIYPGPIGKGLFIVDAAELLGITQQAAYARLKRFKTRFPKAWEQVKIALKINQKHRLQLRYGASHGHPFNSNKDDFDILEKF